MSDSQQIVMMNGQVMNENLTASQKLWLEQIGYYQATIITSQPTEWDGKLKTQTMTDQERIPMERLVSINDITALSDQISERISALQH